MLDLVSWLRKLTINEKEIERKRIFSLWKELEECEQAYKHKKSLGDKMLAQAQKVDDMQLPFMDKMTKKEIYLNAARDNFDKADSFNQRIKALAKEIQMAMK